MAERRGAAALLILVLTVSASPVRAGGMSLAEHDAAMAEIAATRAAMAEARVALVAGAAAPGEAAARTADLDARLNANRAMMTAAVRRDRTSVPFAKLTPERQRARCVVMAAGLIDEPLRDLWTLWSLRARGAPDPADWQAKTEGVSGLGKAAGCG